MKLHKRILSVLLAGVMLSGLALTACNKSGGGKGGAGSSHREVKNVEPKGQVIMGTTTEPSGDWTWGAFSANNATDSDVVFLTDDLGTVSTDEGGSYVINNTVVESYERTEDADGNATYTFKIKEGLKFNNGEPIKAENYLAWTMFIISPAGQEYGATSVGYNSIPGGLDYKDGKVNYLAGARLLGEYECSITTLKTGEALVSFLDEHGAPGVVERATILPPQSHMGAISPEVRAYEMNTSPIVTADS